MAKPDLGTKRICVSCGMRFYDLGKQPAICPKCSTEQPAEQPRLRRAPGNVVDTRRPKAAPVPGLEDTDVEVEVAEDDADEDVLEDTTDLDDGEEGIEVDVIVEPEGGEEER